MYTLAFHLGFTLKTFNSEILKEIILYGNFNSKFLFENLLGSGYEESERWTIAGIFLES